jgi:hypothetical protein
MSEPKVEHSDIYSGYQCACGFLTEKMSLMGDTRMFDFCPKCGRSRLEAWTLVPIREIYILHHGIFSERKEILGLEIAPQLREGNWEKGKA